MDKNNLEPPLIMREKKIFIPESLGYHHQTGEKVEVFKEPPLPVTISEKTVKQPASEIASVKHYNSFNFLKLSKSYSLKKTVIGVTSANKRDGKTMVAVNMAISLAKGYQQRTLLIDFNFLNPQLHKIFDAPLGPGLADAMENKILKVHPTPEKDLFIMTAGNSGEINPGIEHTLILRHIFNTLKEEFEFIVIDMTSILPINEFPVHFINEIDGLISVIDVTKTKKTDFQKVFNHLDEKRFMGYVFNKVSG